MEMALATENGEEEKEWEKISKIAHSLYPNDSGDSSCQTAFRFDTNELPCNLVGGMSLREDAKLGPASI
ncbi:hypothetical protein EGR_06253 [Echinococcus granulosus]|uniref:Uncharacterized protein n=1 Tax=Echinococcus granulosus TaxID=6210 RepID=W6UZ14_ECHGR|nr:hypothetical protein EGR_06253 [Echinococcus granulosus]EUB58829.1 hypothetical protein EGR_06253 [Echinococcus granulosus]